MKKLFLLKQGDEDEPDYDTYDSCVVCAESAEKAILIHPRTGFHADNADSRFYEFRDDGRKDFSWYNDWAKYPNQVKCTEIGIANDSIELNSVVISSYNAG